MTGSLEMHPLFLSIGNINSHIRMAATSHAWQCVAFMPIPKFETHPDYQSILQARVWHKCVDLVTANLKRAANFSVYIPDPNGHIQYCFTPLAAWMADLPEQLMIACIAKSASPVSEASTKDFGDDVRHTPHTAKVTINHICELAKDANPWDLARFQKLAKLLLLSGVHLPFWRDWPFSDPHIFLVPEILHTLHKFFFNHILKWCKEVVGDKLDKRFKAQHKRIAARHFAGGVSHIKQMTGQEHRDIQRTLVAIIATAPGVEAGFLQAIQAMIDFIYQAQSPVHTESSVQKMEDALHKFHDYKHAIVDAGARKTQSGSVKTDFYIPKLELLQHFTTSIHHSGLPIQYTADVSKRLLCTHCKNPFQRTNKHGDFAEQVIHILDCEEMMRQYDLYMMLHTNDIPLVNAIEEEKEEVHMEDPTREWISRVLPSELRQISAPCTIHNHFSTGILSHNVQTALHVTASPDARNTTPDAIIGLYNLPDFSECYGEYLKHFVSPSNLSCIWHSFNHFFLYHKLRMQLRSTFHPSMVMPSQVVQAKPPSNEYPYRCCDAVLISSGDNGMYSHESWKCTNE